jgi:hypothetical protein
MERTYPQIIGHPGGSLGTKDLKSQFGNRADIGARAEQKTATMVLNPICERGGATVLHDVRLHSTNRSGGSREGNIDHILISGTSVFLIDTKMWQPGFYWTFGGTSRRGLTKVPHLDKGTMEWARNFIEKVLSERRVTYTIKGVYIFVWPSRDDGTSLRLYHPRGAQAVLASHGDRAIGRVRPASQEIVAALYPLVINP